MRYLTCLCLTLSLVACDQSEAPDYATVCILKMINYRKIKDDKTEMQRP